MEWTTVDSDGTVTTSTCEEPEPGGPCFRCKKHPGTEIVHGMPGGISYWCRPCIVRSQLEHAIGEAAKIPELKAELARLLDG